MFSYREALQGYLLQNPVADRKPEDEQMVENEDEIIYCSDKTSIISPHLKEYNQWKVVLTDKAFYLKQDVSSSGNSSNSQYYFQSPSANGIQSRPPSVSINSASNDLNVLHHNNIVHRIDLLSVSGIDHSTHTTDPNSQDNSVVTLKIYAAKSDDLPYLQKMAQNERFANYISYLQLDFCDRSLAFRWQIALNRSLRECWQYLFETTILPNKIKYSDSNGAGAGNSGHDDEANNASVNDADHSQPLANTSAQPLPNVSNVANASVASNASYASNNSNTLNPLNTSSLGLGMGAIDEKNEDSSVQALDNSVTGSIGAGSSDALDELSNLSKQASSASATAYISGVSNASGAGAGLGLSELPQHVTELYQFHSFVIKVSGHGYECDRLLLISTQFVYFITLQPTKIELPTVLKAVKWAVPIHGIKALTLDTRRHRSGTFGSRGHGSGSDSESAAHPPVPKVGNKANHASDKLASDKKGQRHGLKAPKSPSERGGDLHTLLFQMDCDEIDRFSRGFLQSTRDLMLSGATTTLNSTSLKNVYSVGNLSQSMASAENDENRDNTENSENYENANNKPRGDLLEPSGRNKKTRKSSNARLKLLSKLRRTAMGTRGRGSKKGGDVEYAYKYRILTDSEFKKFGFKDEQERLVFVREIERMYFDIKNENLTLVECRNGMRRERSDSASLSVKMDGTETSDKNAQDVSRITLDNTGNESGSRIGGYLMKFRKLNQQKAVRKWVRWLPNNKGKVANKNGACGVVEWSNEPNSFKVEREIVTGYSRDARFAKTVTETQHYFVLICQKRTLAFAALDNKELSEWMSALEASNVPLVEYDERFKE